MTDGPPLCRGLVLACLPRTGGRRLAAALARSGLVGDAGAHVAPLVERGVTLDRLPDEMRAVRARATAANGTFAVRLRWPTVAALGGTALAPELVCPAPTAWVVVTAEDRFAQAASWELAEQRAGGGAPAYDFPGVAGRFADVCTEETAWDAYLDAHGIAPLLVTREQVRDDLLGTIRAVLAHAGLPSLRPMTVPDPLSVDPMERAWAERFGADLAEAALRDDPSSAA